jgi:hypothetical protein
MRESQLKSGESENLRLVQGANVSAVGLGITKNLEEVCTAVEKAFQSFIRKLLYLET